MEVGYFLWRSARMAAASSPALRTKNDPPPTEPHREFALHSRKQTHGEMSFSPPTSAPVLLPPDLPLTREQRLESREFSTAGRISPG